MGNANTSDLIPDILDTIKNFGKDTHAAIKSAAETIRRSVVEAQASTEHQSNTRVLSANVPTLLVDYDRQRTRMLVRAFNADDDADVNAGIFIGDIAQLTGGNGYKLLTSTGGGEEVKVIAPVYAIYRPVNAAAPDLNASVSYWVERNA